MDRLEQLRRLHREGHLPVKGPSARAGGAPVPAASGSSQVTASVGNGFAPSPGARPGAGAARRPAAAEDPGRDASWPSMPVLEPTTTPAGTAYRCLWVYEASFHYGHHPVEAWYRMLATAGTGDAVDAVLAGGSPSGSPAPVGLGPDEASPPSGAGAGAGTRWSARGGNPSTGQPEGARRRTSDRHPPALALLSRLAGPAGLRQDVPPGPEDLLFLDLETTGLSSAAGHRPFLAGLAWFEASADGVPRLACELLVLTDLADEPAFLAALAGRVAERPWLVTFNGRHFDWPLLENRWLLHRQQPPRLRAHWDLLYPARRLWAPDGQPCHLRALEQRWLGHRRQDDVAGAEIPRLFTRYLQSGDLTELLPVFRHNVWDLLALAGLTAFTATYLLRSPGLVAAAGEALRIGREWERVDAEVAGAWYERALALAAGRAEVMEAARRLLHLYRSRRRWGEAVALQAALCDTHHPLAPLEPWLELARLWLRLDDPARAHRYLQAAERLTTRRRPWTTASTPSSPWAAALSELRRQVETRLSQQRAVP